MAKRTISQKRWVRGVNAGTGILTQPPSTITRASNIFFNQRGSLTTCDGSAIIGQLISPNVKGVAIGTFSNLSSGQYPYYPTLTAPPGYDLPDVANITAVPSGSASNPAGSYTFAIVAKNATEHSDPQQGTITISPLASFGSILFNWTADANATAYDVYYLPGGVGAAQGVLLSSPSTNTYTFTGVLPTTPLVSLPIGNTSFNLQLQIGNVVAPSKQVFFVVPASSTTRFPSSIPQPAQVSPGDPNFQFQTAFSNTQVYAGGTGSTSSFQSGMGSDPESSGAISGFPVVVIASGQIVAFTLVIEGSVTKIPANPTVDIEGNIQFQFSIDGGSTFTTFYTLDSTSTVTYPPTTVMHSVSGLTSLNLLQFQILTNATVASATGSCSVTASIDSSSVSVSTNFSFTPYGGAVGFADYIPQIIQFDQLSILILGNGFAPQSCDPSALTGTTCSALTNTFQSTYPDWQATVGWVVGDNIAVLIGGTNYVFVATQGGTSGATMPTFPATLGATVQDGQVVWKNTGPLTTTVSPRGAAHGIVYAGSLWLGNTSPETTADQIDGPTCIKMSDSDNPNSWNPVNVAFLGKDDGTQITGMTTYTVAEVGIAPTGSLVVFKEFTTYQIIGVFGASDFQITQAQTDLGCISARSIQFLSGYGIMRLTHMGFSIFDGVKDRLISEEIRPYLYGGIQLNADIVGIDFTFCYLSYGVQTAIPPMYICACPVAGAGGTLSRVFVYDLVLKAWTILDLPWSITTLLQARTGEGTPLTIGFRGDGTGILERFFAGDASWDAASLVTSLPATQTPIRWAFSSVYIYEEGSSKRGFYREVVIRGQSTQTAASLVTVTITADGNPAMTFETYLYPQPFSGQFQLDIDLMFTAQIVNIAVTGTGLVTIDGLDWSASEKPGGRLMIG